MLLVIAEYEILDVDQADDIVLILLIHGKPGVHGLPENLQHIAVGGIHADCHHIDSGDHDILGHGIGEVKHIVDHLLFFGLDDTVLMAYVYISL